MGYTQPHPAPSTMSGTWWAMVLRGIVAVLFGSAALLWPELTLLVLLACFGVYALIDGLLALVAGTRASEGRRWLLLAEGAIGFLVGLVVLFWPGQTAPVLVYAISAWAIFTGLLRVIMPVSFRRQIENAWLVGLGALSPCSSGSFWASCPGLAPSRWCGSSGSTRSSSASRWSCWVCSTGVIPRQTQAGSGKAGASEPL